VSSDPNLPAIALIDRGGALPARVRQVATCPVGATAWAPSVGGQRALAPEVLTPRMRAAAARAPGPVGQQACAFTTKALHAQQAGAAAVRCCRAHANAHATHTRQLQQARMAVRACITR
jgi:hypothetical protein